MQLKVKLRFTLIVLAQHLPLRLSFASASDVIYSGVMVTG